MIKSRYDVPHEKRFPSKDMQTSDGSNNRNRSYFFNNREYFKKFLYNKLFYICLSSNCNYVIATYYFFCNFFFQTIGIYSLILFLKFVILKFL